MLTLVPYHYVINFTRLTYCHYQVTFNGNDKISQLYRDLNFFNAIFDSFYQKANKISQPTDTIDFLFNFLDIFPYFVHDITDNFYFDIWMISLSHNLIKYFMHVFSAYITKLVRVIWILVVNSLMLYYFYDVFENFHLIFLTYLKLLIYL